MLTEFPTNPRRVFDEAFLKELASSIDAQGVLAFLLVRPKNQHYEIVFGAQRFCAAQIAGKESVPVEIRDMTDAQLVANQKQRLGFVVQTLGERVTLQVELDDQIWFTWQGHAGDLEPAASPPGSAGAIDIHVPSGSVQLITARLREMR